MVTARERQQSIMCSLSNVRQNAQLIYLSGSFSSVVIIYEKEWKDCFEQTGGDIPVGFFEVVMAKREQSRVDQLCRLNYRIEKNLLQVAWKLTMSNGRLPHSDAMNSWQPWYRLPITIQVSGSSRSRIIVCMRYMATPYIMTNNMAID